SDKDGGYSEYETSVVILPVNQAPTATLVVSGSPADEGGTVTVALENVSDAPADLAAGLTYSFDLDGDGVYELSGASGSASAMFGDNGTYAVNARVTDRYGAHSDYSAQVVVNNVAPVSSLLAPATGDEGSALVISLGPVTDPSAADVAAGFTYSFDFNNDGVYEVSGSNASVTHVFDDNGHYIVRARVTDKDGGSSDYSAEVHVKNVAPKSIRFWDNNPKAEGTLVTVGFDAVSDPSGADTAAGFTYSYDFDNDGVYEVTSRSATATHTFNDNGVFTVRGRVTDKDGGSTEYTADVNVANAAPVITSLTSSASTFGSARQGSTVRVNGMFTDAGVTDTHTAVIDWGDGTTSAASLSE